MHLRGLDRSPLTRRPPGSSSAVTDVRCQVVKAMPRAQPGKTICYFFLTLAKARNGVGLDRVDRAFRLADPAIDAFVRVDDEHVLALVEAVHGAYLDAVHGFAANAAIVDDVRQLSVLSADRSGELIHGVRYRG